MYFAYAVIFGSILSFQWFTFGSLNDYMGNFGNNFDGYEIIRKSQEYSLKYGGELTEESLQQMVRDCQSAENAKFPYKYISYFWKVCMVSVSADYRSCADWCLLYAFCSKRLVKTDEGMMRNGEKEKFEEEDGQEDCTDNGSSAFCMAGGGSNAKQGFHFFFFF